MVGEVDANLSGEPLTSISRELQTPPFSRTDPTDHNEASTPMSYFPLVQNPDQNGLVPESGLKRPNEPLNVEGASPVAVLPFSDTGKGKAKESGEKVAEGHIQGENGNEQQEILSGINRAGMATDGATGIAPAEAFTPQGRPSVQFKRSAFGNEPGESSHIRSNSGGFTDGDHRRGGSILTKLKAITSSSGGLPHTRSPSSFTAGGDSSDERSHKAQFTPGSKNEDALGHDEPHQEESDEDADAEESGEEVSPAGDRLRDTSGRIRRRRPHDEQSQIAPSTPKSFGARDIRPNFWSNNSANANPKSRPSFLRRRSTTTSLHGESPQGVSEDEGRQRLSRSHPWRRGNGWVHGPRGMSYGGIRKHSQQPNTEDRRPSHFRRLTGFGGTPDGPDGSAPSPWRMPRVERASTLGGAKWQVLKTGLKMFGPSRRRPDQTIDHEKSAELLAELTAGVPAALILASMFQRDEHGNKRIPILLEQLKVRLTDSKQVDSKSGDRHMIFRIEMEYGNGLTRMKWVVHRALRDFANLHARYKLQVGAQKYIQLKPGDARTKLPHFPRSTFPYLRGIRGLDSDTEEGDDQDREDTGPSGGETSGAERPGKKKKKKKTRPTLSAARRKSSAVTSQGADGAAVPGPRETFPERQRKKLELYLQQMIRYLIFRPESNRLCKFLELSALGVRLAAEGSYHGKEGLLIIQSGKGVDFRRALTPAMITGRHGPKWFSVRHSYLVCVDSPEEMNIYDVFLVDSSFQIKTKRKRLRDQQKPKDIAKAAKDSASPAQHHTLKLYNSERKLKLLAKNERQLHQFEESIKFMASNTPWAKPKRFDSFAPVRKNVFAQWLVDGRDYMWNVSRAISMAKDVIYIHDWWLSPELYLRRPAAISQKWRLDRLLQRKAREGVKVFVLMYRNINSAIPIDSEYTKFSLLDLHPNVFVQRSPNQIRQNTFFWAHHEKLCIIDHMVAFIGGIDLCFGRWDTPQHSVVDDKPTGFEDLSEDPKDADHCQLWPGKDYSNPRVQDFYALDKPYEEMYNRAKVPRMPWHDIHMQIVGQPARDLTRHFVQRWNYILRQRKPTRPTPFLLPPPDFSPADLESLGLDGTCEVQILRSACSWSLGTPDRTEHSIMNAYIKMIEESDHFVYIENQFFISSCEVEGTRIENKIGDALVERIVRAFQNKEDWKAIIIIPLMPGFQNTVDQPDGTSVRLIMQCQFRSICRGETSIFGRLRAQGIEPEDYIQFYSLRSWGKIGPQKQIVTEQLYIHAKCMVVDDRVAIIGSANINERSMLGSRDSECAAVVRDTDMSWSTMNGEPYLVGRFPHTLRMRLMREHLGLDVDEIMEEDQQQEEMEAQDQQPEQDQEKQNAELLSDPEAQLRKMELNRQVQEEVLHKSENMASFNHDVDWEQDKNPNLMVNKKPTEDPRVTNNEEHKKDVGGEGFDKMQLQEEAGNKGRRDSRIVRGPNRSKEVVIDSEDPSMAKGIASPGKSVSPKRSPSRRRSSEGPGNASLPPQCNLIRNNTARLGLTQLSQLPPLPVTDDTDIGGPPIQRSTSQRSANKVHPLIGDLKRPYVHKDCMRDPLNDSFFHDTWHAIAENNTKLFRLVFRCMPDNEVKSWKEYKEYAAYAERFSQVQGGGKSQDRMQQDAPGSSGPPGSQGTIMGKPKLPGPIGEKVDAKQKRAESLIQKVKLNLGKKDGPTDSAKANRNNYPMGKVEEWAEEASRAQAERQAREAKEKSPSPPPPNTTDGTVDEKPSPLRSSNELRNLPSLDHPDPTSKSSNSPSASLLNQNPTNHTHSANPANPAASQKRRKRAATKGSRREFRASDDIISAADAEELLLMVQGHLVAWPYDWLAREEQGGNWLYSIDGLAPLEI